MKKFTVILVLSFVGIPSLYSQIKFGVKAGTSYSTILFSDDLKPDEGDVKYRFGFIGGITSEIRIIGKAVFLQPEFLFHQKGFNYSTDLVDDPSSPDHSLKSYVVLNYLEMPILVKVKFGRFYAIGGPSILLGIGGNYKRVETYKSPPSADFTKIETGKVKFAYELYNSTSDETFFHNRIDVSIQGGLGMKISIITVELRYALGLLNPADKPDNYTGDYRLKNSSLQLAVGIPVEIKK